MDYTKIIFVSKENVLLGPMAEWIMKSILMDKSKQIMSRGLVVLFAEPRDQRVTELLMNHGVPCEEPDPYGSGDEAYEECYLELKDLLYRVKKKLQWN